MPKKALQLAIALLLPGAAWSLTPLQPPPSSGSVYPLAQVHAGLTGTAYTVFEGTQPEAFGVTILGVLRNASGPGEDLILARLTGAKPEYTGVVAGMSGSPVYIDGKLVGALSYRIGQFSKEPIAGITPIAEMLQVRNMHPTPSAKPPGNLPTLPVPGSDAIKPIDTPLVFSGFSKEALALWKQHAPALGMEPVAGIGSSQATSGPSQKDSMPPLEPGSSVSALLVEGDLEIAATCTVTYLSENHLLACGHPLTQFGNVSLPMTKADVVTTLASPAGSFKIVNTGETVGAFNEDRQTAIGGLLGATAHMIPVNITIHGADRGPGGMRQIHLKVLDQSRLTPTAILVSLYQALQESPGYAEEDSYRVHATVHLAGYPPVIIRTLAAPGSLGGAPLMAALSVGQSFDTLYSSTDRTTPVESVDVAVNVLSGRHSTTLSRAAVEQTAVRAGDRITVAATLAQYRGASRSIRIPVTLPASLGDGTIRLLVSDGETLDRLLSPSPTADSTPLSSTIAQLNEQHPDDRLYVTLLAPDAQVSVDGRVLSMVPLSIANLLAPSHERERSSLHSESAQTLASVPLDASVSGQQILTLRVE